MEFIFISIGIVSGALAAWFAARYFYNKPVDEQVFKENTSLHSEKSHLEGEIKAVREQFLSQTKTLEQLQSDNVRLRENLIRSESNQEHLLEKLEQQKKQMRAE